MNDLPIPVGQRTCDWPGCTDTGIHVVARRTPPVDGGPPGHARLQYCQRHLREALAARSETT